jgi:hypothetical protein
MAQKVKSDLQTDGKISVNTTDANASLDVNGAGNFSGGTVVSGVDTKTNVGVAIAKGTYLQSNDGNYVRQLIGHTSGGNIEIGQAGTGLIGDITLRPGTTGAIAFYGSGSEDARFDSSGNLGVGTASPARKVQVGDGTDDDRIRTYFSDGTYSEITGYGLELSRSTSYIRPNGTSGTKTLAIGGVTNWNIINSYAATDFKWHDGSSSEIMRLVSSDGSLQLNSYGSGSITGTATKMLAVDASGNVVEETLPSGGGIDGAGVAGAMTKWTDADSIEDSDFMTESAGGVQIGTDALTYVHSSKRIGIHTTTPSVAFDCAGQAKFQSGVYDGSNNLGTNGQILSSTGIETLWVDAPDTGMTNFTIAASSGTANTIEDGDILGIAAGTGMLTNVSGNTVTVTNNDLGSSQAIFKNVAVSGQSTITADTNNDTLTISPGTGLEVTTNSLTDTMTFTPKMTTMHIAQMLHSVNVSTSWYYLPWTGTVESTSRALQHSMVMPFNGYVRSITYRGAGTGTATSATTLKYRILRNGGVIYTSTSLSLGSGTSSSKDVHLDLSSSDATFTQQHRLEIQIQANSTLQNALFTVIFQES